MFQNLRNIRNFLELPERYKQKTFTISEYCVVFCDRQLTELFVFHLELTHFSFNKLREKQAQHRHCSSKK